MQDLQLELRARGEEKGELGRELEDLRLEHRVYKCALAVAFRLLPDLSSMTSFKGLLRATQRQIMGHDGAPGDDAADPFASDEDTHHIDDDDTDPFISHGGDQVIASSPAVGHDDRDKDYVPNWASDSDGSHDEEPALVTPVKRSFDEMHGGLPATPPDSGRRAQFRLSDEDRDHVNEGQVVDLTTSP